MAWNVVFVDEFATWLDEQDRDVRIQILKCIELLKERGPQLGRPYADTLKGTARSNLKELRVQYQGAPWRILFAFDPKRSAVILVGGNKAVDRRWYETYIPIAEHRLRRYLTDQEE